MILLSIVFYSFLSSQLGLRPSDHPAHIIIFLLLGAIELVVELTIILLIKVIVS